MALQPFGAGMFPSLFDPAWPFGRGRGGEMDWAPFPSLTSMVPTAGSAHPLDVVETNDAFRITVDAPGMDANDISISLSEGRVLTISGKKKHEVEEKDREGRVLRRERAFSTFSRSFTLPENVQEGEITANLDKGVLEVVVPKVEPPPRPEPKRIAVNAVPHTAGDAPKVTHQQK
ncbi:hsp20-family heat shock chaperone [Raphidocelis subcapitata]|uniref:Hsp20-family heat shock chaperone n=1 Tax=Raphidocelis subcapitata TaxID=307507 RepID=A0A2V0PL18_9CHLO|nr:hsp20-family heat shock chaperone [Raphidocelis subcapitata]|eukprot:GBF99742.1 hsp20-family heat shock chaperone [Raphidocelis subcapitata]